MPISTPSGWTRPSNTAAALAVLAVLAAGQAPWAVAQSDLALRDAHLSTLPRSADEAARIAAATALPRDPAVAWPFEAMAGGAQTTRPADTFLVPAANLDALRRLDFHAGQALFERFWTTAPSATLASDGLGPLFNARSCLACHPRGGRGQPPSGDGAAAAGLVLHLSVPAPDPAALETYVQGTAATAPDPVYGRQVQDLALPGMAPEGRIAVTYEEIAVPLSGGEVAHLHRPSYALRDPGYGPLSEGAMIGPRLAPALIGLGLIEAIPAEAILAGADPDDADGDGISGRAQVVWSLDLGVPMLGRFGWKAGHATVRAQVAQALAGDIGLSSPPYPDGWGDCTRAQTACRAARHGGDPEQGGFELDETGLALLTGFTRSLAVPARRDVDDPEVLRGRGVFFDTGCAACHRPAFVTHRLADGDPASFQLIWPYTDLLLHDMGDGLADGRPEGRASGREWRTAPLWGIGLTAVTPGPTHLLHDGRARSLLEAVLWHGGEAQAARDIVVAMPPADRAALIRYLESL